MFSFSRKGLGNITTTERELLSLFESVFTRRTVPAPSDLENDVSESGESCNLQQIQLHVVPKHCAEGISSGGFLSGIRLSTTLTTKTTRPVTPNNPSGHLSWYTHDRQTFPVFFIRLGPKDLGDVSTTCYRGAHPHPVLSKSTLVKSKSCPSPTLVIAREGRRDRDDYRLRPPGLSVVSGYEVKVVPCLHLGFPSSKEKRRGRVQKKKESGKVKEGKRKSEGRNKEEGERKRKKKR